MSNDTIYGLFKRGEDEPVLAGKDADLLQRLRKREYGDSPDWKVANVDADVTFAEPEQPESTTAGLDQRKAEIRHKLFEEKLTEELADEVESAAEADAKEAAESVEDDEDDDEKLTGQDLDDAIAEAGIDTSTGGSLADGSMNADEKRAALDAQS